MENTTTERLLAAALLTICLCLAGLEINSGIAARRRNDLPVFTWLQLRSSSPVDPAVPAFLLSYSWRYRTLHIVSIPPSIPPESVKTLVTQAAGEFPTLTWETDHIPAGSTPEGLKAWITQWPRDLRFWLRVPRALGALRPWLSASLTPYDLFLLTVEAYRLKPQSIHLIWLTQVHTLPRLTDILMNGGPAGNAAAPVTVEIQNASGESGVALRATKILRWEGFDVLDFGNAAEAQPASQFVDRTGDTQTASRVATLLGCPQAEVLTHIEPDHHVTVTAILGRDYKNCSRFGESENQGKPNTFSKRIRRLWN